jgi:hypothetical protein
LPIPIAFQIWIVVGQTRWARRYEYPARPTLALLGKVNGHPDSLGIISGEFALAEETAYPIVTDPARRGPIDRLLYQTATAQKQSTW